MAAEAKQKAEGKPKGEAKQKGEAKPKAEAKPKGEAKEKKAKAPAEEPAAEAPKAPPPPPAPKQPADARLRILKKFHGAFLPKGVLRDRHKALMARWDSGGDHGGVKVQELQSLLDDWKGTREKPPRLPKA